jgi:hypothetical protein
MEVVIKTHPRIHRSKALSLYTALKNPNGIESPITKMSDKPAKRKVAGIQRPISLKTVLDGFV